MLCKTLCLQELAIKHLLYDKFQNFIHIEKNTLDRPCTFTICEIAITEETNLNTNMDTDLDALDSIHRAAKRP